MSFCFCFCSHSSIQTILIFTITLFCSHHLHKIQPTNFKTLWTNQLNLYSILHYTNNFLTSMRVSLTLTFSSPEKLRALNQIIFIHTYIHILEMWIKPCFSCADTEEEPDKTTSTRTTTTIKASFPICFWDKERETEKIRDGKQMVQMEELY